MNLSLSLLGPSVATENKKKRGSLKMFVVMFVLFVFAILCLCLFSFFRSLTKAMCEL